MPEEARPRQGRAPLASAASGACSGALVSACLQPLDVLRTRMQVDSVGHESRANAGALGSFRNILREGGARSLWHGTPATVIRVGAGAAVHFYSLQLLRGARDARATAHGARADGAVLGDALIGGLSRAIAVTCMCPITTVKTRMETTGPASAAYAYRSVPHALATIARADGVGALWRGLLPAILANAPFSAAHYAIYRRLQTELGARVGPDKDIIVNFGSGAAASLTAAALTQPLDVFRTRAMLGVAAGSRASALREAFGLMAGFGPRVAKRTLQTSAFWTLYEEIFKVLRLGER